MMGREGSLVAGQQSQAFYNVGHLAFLFGFVWVMSHVIGVLSAFSRPLFWAILCSVFLRPIRSKAQELLEQQLSTLHGDSDSSTSTTARTTRSATASSGAAVGGGAPKSGAGGWLLVGLLRMLVYFVDVPWRWAINTLTMAIETLLVIVSRLCAAWVLVKSPAWLSSFVRWVDGYMLDNVRDQLEQNHQMTIQRSVVMITTMTFVVVVVTELRKERGARNFAIARYCVATLVMVALLNAIARVRMRVLEQAWFLHWGLRLFGD